jgi:hypothetical protein
MRGEPHHRRSVDQLADREPVRRLTRPPGPVKSHLAPTARVIRRLWASRQPFLVGTIGGKTYHVTHSHHICLSVDGTELVLFDGNGGHRLKLLRIARVESLRRDEDDETRRDGRPSQALRQGRVGFVPVLGPDDR